MAVDENQAVLLDEKALLQRHLLAIVSTLTKKGKPLVRRLWYILHWENPVRRRSVDRHSSSTC